jgi:hypothetical protein
VIQARKIFGLSSRLLFSSKNGGEINVKLSVNLVVSVVASGCVDHSGSDIFLETQE